MSKLAIGMKHPALQRSRSGWVPLQVVVPVASTIVALGIGLLIIASTGGSVSDAVGAFWDGMAGSPYNIGASLNRAISLGLVGLGFIFANRGNLTNVGGEGQIAMGGMFATAVALHGAGSLGAGLSYAVPLAAGAAAGALWGGLAGILKAARGTNEVISTLLLTFIALPLVYWSVESFALLRKPITDLSSLPESPEIPDPTKLPLLFPDDGSPLHIGLPIAVIMAFLVWLVLKHSAFGLRLRAVGLNATASRRAGMQTSRYIVLAMAVSGGLGGLAGAIMVLGQQFYLTSDFSSGYGFDGLVVGLLSRGSVIGVVLGALLFGFLRSGSINMEISAQVPAAVVLICQGLIVIIIAGSAMFTDRKVGR
jgi:general nucleoside transport system permease protein